MNAAVTSDTTKQASIIAILRGHWSEYLIEAWALGTFMLSACGATILLEHPDAWLHQAIGNADLRRALIGVAMGLTAIALIYSPWGKRSGAHMNPAITLAFLRLGKIARIDAYFYVTAQFIGGLAGVLLTAAVFGDRIADPAVAYAVTTPGTHSVATAFSAEFGISFLMLTVILQVSSSKRYEQYTGLIAGLLVATFITLEAPFSGMSMNPARSFASALPANVWTHFWIYLLAPVLAMQLAASLYIGTRGRAAAPCAKLSHPTNQRCVHCGYTPSTPPATSPV